MDHIENDIGELKYNPLNLPQDKMLRLLSTEFCTSDTEQRVPFSSAVFLWGQIQAR